jgi:hypothetical protein
MPIGNGSIPSYSSENQQLIFVLSVSFSTIYTNMALTSLHPTTAMGAMLKNKKKHRHHQMTQHVRLYSRKKTRKSRRIESFEQPSMLKQLASRGS